MTACCIRSRFLSSPYPLADPARRPKGEWPLYPSPPGAGTLFLGLSPAIFARKTHDFGEFRQSRIDIEVLRRLCKQGENCLRASKLTA